MIESHATPEAARRARRKPLTPLQQRILHEVRQIDPGRFFTTAAMAAAVGGSGGGVGGVGLSLRSLADRGLVVQAQPGLWQVPEAAE